MNLTTFFMIYVKKALKERGVPFRVTTKEIDPFYSDNNLKASKESVQQLKDDKVVHKTLEELETMTID